jgi:hypothetical protein
MRPERIGSLIVIGMMVAAAFPLVCAAAIAKDDMQVEGMWDERVSDRGKPPKPPTDPGTDEPTDKSHLAVVIGIANYQGSNLKYTDDDARDMYSYLISKGYQPGSIKLLIDRAATAKKIIAAIDWLDQYETPVSEVVFFYSGHGTQWSDQLNGDEADGIDECIVSQDRYAITDDRLQSEFSTISSTKFGIVFDSCFSGGMDDLSAGGRVVVTACKEGELSYDGDATMQNGVFTYYFMQSLYTYNTLEDAYTYSYGSVQSWGATYGIEFHPQMYDQYGGYWTF